LNALVIEINTVG